jgi:hypothetical protein
VCQKVHVQAVGVQPNKELDVSDRPQGSCDRHEKEERHKTDGVHEGVGISASSQRIALWMKSQPHTKLMVLKPPTLGVDRSGSTWIRDQLTKPLLPMPFFA